MSSSSGTLTFMHRGQRVHVPRKQLSPKQVRALIADADEAAAAANPSAAAAASSSASGSASQSDPLHSTRDEGEEADTVTEEAEEEVLESAQPEAKKRRKRPAAASATPSAAAAVVDNTPFNLAGFSAPVYTALTGDALTPATLVATDWSPLREVCFSASEIYRSVTPAHALQEFARFLLIKVLLSDVDALRSAPSPLMELLWRAAVLDTRFYESLQASMGMKMHHAPSGASSDPTEAAHRAIRRQVTTATYTQLFGHAPLGEAPASSKLAASGPASMHDFVGYPYTESEAPPARKVRRDWRGPGKRKRTKQVARKSTC